MANVLVFAETRANALRKVALEAVTAARALADEHAGYTNFDRESVSSTIAARAKAGSYRAVVLGFSAQGRDIGPRLAAKLDAPIVSDVIDVQLAGDALTVKHPGYANKVVLTLEIVGAPAVVSVRPSA